MKQVLKNFEKNSEIFWRFKKRSYLCSRFEIEKSTLRASKEVLKNFEKILQKDLENREKGFTFAAAFESQNDRER